MKKTAMLACSAAVGSMLLVGPVSAGNGTYGSQEIRSIVGSWQVEVTLHEDAEDCSAAPLIPFPPNPFPSLNTFHEGGTMSETGSRSPPSRRSPGHGVWERVGKYRYEGRYTFQGFDVSGLLVNTSDIRTEIKLSKNGNRFKGVGRLAFTDLSGNTFTACGILDGVRFSL